MKARTIRLLLSLGLMLVWPFASGPANAQWHEQTRHLMGTEVSVELWHENEREARALMESVFTEVQRLDVMMNPWNEASELARINREAGRRSVSTTAEVFTVLERALHYSRLSGGAFDISFASVGQHFDYREAVRPSDAKIEADKPNIDYQAIKLIPVTRQIKFDKSGLQIDLGGIAKGYAVDAAIEILKQEHVRAAVVTAGGDSRILGNLGDRPRTVGIRHPRKAGEYAVLIPLEDTAISTSGDYERFFKENGKRYHHILDPKTGHSAGAVRSASVLAPTAMESDALSTTVFVLGVERGLELINRLSGVDAIVIDSRGNLHYSEELLLSE